MTDSLSSREVAQQLQDEIDSYQRSHEVDGVVSDPEILRTIEAFRCAKVAVESFEQLRVNARRWAHIRFMGFVMAEDIPPSLRFSVVKHIGVQADRYVDGMLAIKREGSSQRNKDDIPFSENIFVGLLTGTNAYDEVQAPSYSRMRVGPLTEENDTKYNRDKIQFNKATTDWGLITHAGFYDRETGGLLLSTTPLVVPKKVSKGDMGPIFQPENLRLLLPRVRRA